MCFTLSKSHIIYNVQFLCIQYPNAFLFSFNIIYKYVLLLYNMFVIYYLYNIYSIYFCISTYSLYTHKSKKNVIYKQKVYCILFFFMFKCFISIEKITNCKKKTKTFLNKFINGI